MKGLSPTLIHEDLHATYGSSAPSLATVKRWSREFKHGRLSLEDDPHLGRPVSARSQHNVDRVHDIVMKDRRLTLHYIAKEVGIAESTVHRILTEDLGMTKVSARWVPRLLTPDQKRVRQRMSRDNLALFNSDPDGFMARFVTQDETWVHHFEPESKMQSKQWKRNTSPYPRKAKVVPSAGKIMASVFWDAKGVILIDYLPKGQTINGPYYANLIRKLRVAIREKRPGMLSRGVLYHHDNAPAHKSAVAMAALHASGFTQIDHPPYSPDLAPSDFHLFPSMKRALSGVRFQSNDELINAVDEFCSEKEESFYVAGIRALQYRWKKCSDLKGDYVEK